MKFDSDFRMLIGGGLMDSAERLPVINPATGKSLAYAPACSASQLDEAVAAAQAGFCVWKFVTTAERQRCLNLAADRIETHLPELARLFTLEQGRPTDGASGEIALAVAWLRAFALMEPPVHVTELGDGQHIETRHVPLGVVCAISPWNFPVSLSVWKIAPALAAGNAIVLKPSPFTPLCVLKIGELLRDVFPAGVLNIVSGGDELGPLMTAHPGFAKISFTGSTATGKKVMESAAHHLKRLTLELGGNDAAIVMPDVDVDAVAQKIFFGAFFNTAQICVATKRLYVHDDIYDALRDRLLALAAAIKVGDGSEQGTILGPIQNARQYERVMGLIENARADGLTLWQGAEVPDNGGFFVPVTIVDNGLEGLLEYMAPQSIYLPVETSSA